jgi:response regulator NasT
MHNFSQQETRVARASQSDDKATATDRIEDRPITSVAELDDEFTHELRNAFQRIQSCTRLLAWQVEGDESKRALVADLQSAQDEVVRLCREFQNSLPSTNACGNSTPTGPKAAFTRPHQESRAIRRAEQEIAGDQKLAESLRITIADDDARMRDFLWTSLERMGHIVASAACTGRELVEQCRKNLPQLVICDIKMPDMDGIDAAGEIYEFQAVPIILVSAFHDEELIQRASQRHILAYLVKPIKESDLQPAIAVAWKRSHEFETLQCEADDLKQALEDRKSIERAKGILMQHSGLSEPDAFRRLQKLATSKSEKLVVIARNIITAEEAFQSDGQQ